MSKKTPKTKRTATTAAHTKPTHITGVGTQKYQAHGPSAWAPFFKALAEKIGGKGTPAGIGIRAALAYAKEHEKELLKPSTVVAGQGTKEHAPQLRAVDLVGGPRNFAKVKVVA